MDGLDDLLAGMADDGAEGAGDLWSGRWVALGKTGRVETTPTHSPPAKSRLSPKELRLRKDVRLGMEWAFREGSPFHRRDACPALWLREKKMELQRATGLPVGVFYPRTVDLFLLVPERLPRTLPWELQSLMPARLGLLPLLVEPHQTLWRCNPQGPYYDGPQLDKSTAKNKYRIPEISSADQQLRIAALFDADFFLEKRPREFPVPLWARKEVAEKALVRRLDPSRQRKKEARSQRRLLQELAELHHGPFYPAPAQTGLPRRSSDVPLRELLDERYAEAEFPQRPEGDLSQAPAFLHWGEATDWEERALVPRRVPPWPFYERSGAGQCLGWVAAEGGWKDVSPYTAEDVAWAQRTRGPKVSAFGRQPFPEPKALNGADPPSPFLLPLPHISKPKRRRKHRNPNPH